MTQVNSDTIRAEQMRDIASKNKTSYGLLLYLAIQAENLREFNIRTIAHDLADRGIDVNEQHLYDSFQDLEDLGLGSIIYAKRGEGDDIFKRGYNLKMYARRAFPQDYLYNWESKLGQESDKKVKFVDPNFRFQRTVEEKKEEKESSGRRGRPAGYSHKLGRYFTPEEMAAREAMKANPRPRGRPVGWRKPEDQRVTALKASSGGKRGRPPGYSPKLGRFLTPKELAAKTKVPGKRGRPVGWRKNPSESVTPMQYVQRKQPENKREHVMQASKAGARVLNIPLKNNREIRIELPKNLSSDEKALLKLNLDTIL